MLFPGRPDSGQLAAWQSGMSAECARYEALFPRAWTTDTDPLPGVQFVCRQLSPVIAHNYRESSPPVSEFRRKITNTGAEPATIGLMLTFQNGMGAANDMAGGHANQHFASEESRGALRELAEPPSIAADAPANDEDDLGALRTWKASNTAW